MRFKSAAVAAYDGNELIQATNAERDEYRAAIAKVLELVADHDPDSGRGDRMIPSSSIVEAVGSVLPDLSGLSE